jgi:hypothetical protein
MTVASRIVPRRKSSEEGPHTLKIVNKGEARVVLDAFDVMK